MSNEGILDEFRQYGKNIQIVAICTILGFLSITPLIVIIFMFIALGNIKRANLQLNDTYLTAYRSKYISSFVVRIIAVPILVIGILMIVFSAINLFLPFDWMIIFAGISVLIIGLVFFIVSGVIEMRAWENLKQFLVENGDLFPKRIAEEAINGASKLRTAALMYLLGFLGITLIIGFILQVVGYFKLAKLNMLDVSYIAKSETLETPRQQAYQQQVVIPSDVPKFCPACGARLSGEGRFCALCGSEIA
ncbi:MAG: hypothetical protein ACFE85_17460 [Candidatus Hodarchaeota archaeon]